MDTVQVNSENRRRKSKSDERRSSILKIDRPTLADLDVNKKTETRITRRSSKRVSFAETYQVKEFPKDSPQRWLRDLHNADNELEENSSDDKKTTGGSEILGLDKLLNGQIQSQGQENENLNKTVMDGADMEETVCANTSIRQNTTLSNTVCEVDSDEDKKVDTLSFLSNLMKKSQSGSDFEPFIKPQEDSDEEEYKASSFFKGGSNGFFSQTDAVGKIDNKSFLAKLQSINTSSKQFSQEREQREKTENKTVIFDGLDDDMEMTANFTATLQSFKKRQSTGNVLESTRIYADTDDGMEMTRNLTSNLEVIKSNLPISEFEASKNVANVTGQSKLGTSTMLGRSGNRGFDQTRVFNDYEDPTANMDFTVARGEILSNTATAASTEDSERLNSTGVTAHITKQQTGPPAPEQTVAKKPEVPAPCPEVTVHFGQQEIDADMEMTEALDPTLVITNSNMGTTRVKTTKEQLSKSSRALTDVTHHFEADGLTARKEELLTVGNKRKPSISPVDMGKENVTVHFRPVDVQSDMDVTLCLTTQLKSQAKENVVIKEQMGPDSSPEKTKVFTGSEDVANMEFTACIETGKNITAHVDDTISFKKKVNFIENSENDGGVESNSSSVNSDVTRVFGSGDVTAAMELTECHVTLTVNQQTTTVVPSEVKPQKPDVLELGEDKTRAFDTGDATAVMDLTECADLKTKRDSSEGKAEDRTVHFEKQGGSMELTACQTGLVSEGKEEDRTVHFEKRGGSMELTACQPGLVSEGKEEDRTVHFEKRGGSMELTACQPGLVSEGKAEDRTVHFEKQGGSMELTSCQPGLVSEGKAEDRTVLFEKQGGSMELTSCQPGLVSEGKAEDRIRTVLFEKQGGSMELNACQDGLASVPASANAEKTRIFNTADVTAAMEMTACQSNSLPSEADPNSEAKTECNNVAKLEVESDNVEVPQSVEHRQSLPNRVGDSVQGQIAEASTVQQRRSYYGGMVTSSVPGENFSTQSLKRKLYSFDMMMAGAKAKSVKIAKLKDSNETTDGSVDVKKTVPEKTGDNAAPAPENKEDIPPEKSEQTDSPKVEKTEERVTTEIPGRKISRSLSQEVSEHTDILKLGTSDQEVSALEVLKNLALEEDTLDDTKLLELRMLAKKNSGDRPALIAESPSNSPQKNDTVSITNKTVGSDDVFTKTLESEEPPHLPDDDDEEDGNLTQYNTTTALAMMLSKMNKTKAAETTLLEKLSTESSVAPRTGSNLAGSKHGSPDPICSGNKKKPKLEEEDTVEKTAVVVCEDATLDSIEQPVDMKENDTVTSLDSTSPDTNDDNTRARQSQSAMSLSQSLLSYSLLDKKYDETEGPWDFETFCERMGISQFRPKCNRRSSFNIQPAVEADSLHEMLQLQTVTIIETQVKGVVYKDVQEQLDRVEKDIEEQQRSVVDNPPPLFNQLRNSQISQEKVHSCYKACHRWAKAKLKKERVTVSKQCLKKLKAEKDRLCSGIDEVVTQAEKVIADLGSIDTMLADIDQQLEEIKLEPGLTEIEAKKVGTLQERLQLKTEELKKNEEENVEILRQLKEKQQKQNYLETESQKQELQVLKQDDTSDSGRLTEDLQHKLVGMERVLEWRVKELSPARDTFLFLYGAVELSVTYDVIQQKTLDSVSLTSHLAEKSSPWSHLVCRLIVDTVDCVKLRGRYPNREKLPQMLHEISGLVASARSLASEISQIDLRHHVSVRDYSVSVSLLNTRKVQKVVLTFMFEPGTYSCRPADCLLDVVIGKIQKQKVEDILKESVKSPWCLSKCINIVQNMLNS